MKILRVICDPSVIFPLGKNKFSIVYIYLKETLTSAIGRALLCLSLCTF